jgi:hypothetical protein
LYPFDLWFASDIDFTPIGYQLLTEREISVISQNAIFLLFFNRDCLLQAHSAKYNIQYQSEIHIAERACKDQIQHHKERFNGTFAA